MKHINRLKVVLVEKQKTGKWLAEQLGKRSCYSIKMVLQFYPTIR